MNSLALFRSRWHMQTTWLGPLDDRKQWLETGDDSNSSTMVQIHLSILNSSIPLYTRFHYVFANYIPKV